MCPCLTKTRKSVCVCVCGVKNKSYVKQEVQRSHDPQVEAPDPYFLLLTTPPSGRSLRQPTNPVALRAFSEQD